LRRIFLLWVLFLVISSASSEARTWLVRQDGSGDCTTIQACIDSASSGDSILVGPGTYYEHLVIAVPLSLIGELGALQTTIDGGGAYPYARCVTCSHALGRVYIGGLTIANGGVPSLCPPDNTGGGVVCIYAELEIRDCRILSNFGGGVGCRSGSTVTVAYCDIDDNFGLEGDPCSVDGDGVRGDQATGTVLGCSISNPDARAISWFHGSLHALQNDLHENGLGIDLDCTDNATVSRNLIRSGGTGIVAVLANASIVSNTVVGVVGSARRGINILDCTGSISNNIVALGTGYGMDCSGGSVTISCNDVWDNAAGNYRGYCQHPSDISANPMFCGATAGDYHLSSSSPCANAPGCGQIGAFGIGCGQTSVTPTTWGKIKILFR
jgi:hypothetical protein